MKFPKPWLEQIAAGTEFGKRAAKVLQKVEHRITEPSEQGWRPVVSDVGTKILELFETEAQVKLTCGSCLSYTMSLNYTTAHNHAAIVKYMAAEFPWPHWWRLQHTHRRPAISKLIAAVVPPEDTNESTTADPTPIGLRVLSAIELAIGKTISCGACRDYLTAFDATVAGDYSGISQRIAAELPIPDAFQKQYPTKQAWQSQVRLIVDAVLLKHEIPATAVPVISCEPPVVSVVIPCHNYARYLGECLQSVFDSEIKKLQVIVIDDSSEDSPEVVCEQFPAVQYVRCEVRDVHKARGVGLDYVTAPYVCFLDADDKLPPEYFSESLRLFATDRKIMVTYPQLEYFGDAVGPAHGTQHAPSRLTIDDIAQRNWISAGAVWRTTGVRQSNVFKNKTIDGSKCWSQDWHVAKAVLNSGASWMGVKMQTPLLYRKHGINMSSRPNIDYWEDSDFSHEPITLVVAFSGRWACWHRLADWLQTQTWPLQQLRLVIINTTHAPLSTKMLGLEDWGGSLQIERLDVGRSGLADEDRRGRVATAEAVDIAVTAIYNTAIRLLTTEYVVFIEDDVIPESPDTVELLLRQMGPWTAGVSGVYQQRYWAGKTCAFSLPFADENSFKSLYGTGVERVDGTGFGCLLTRRSLLRRFPLSTDGPAKFYDCQFATDCKNADNGNWQWLLNRAVQCDHMVPVNI